MKKSAFLFALIFVFLCGIARAQIVIGCQQGFETTGETGSYTVESGTAQPQTQYYSSGSRALKMNRGTTPTIVVLDTIDFSVNSTCGHFVLEFMHLNTCNPQSGAEAGNCCVIEYRMVGSNQWQQLTGNQHYDMTWGGGSTDFVGTSSFSQLSYNIWANGINNSVWKRERFDLGNVLRGTSVPQRKILIRYRILPVTSGVAGDQAWYLDNIVFRASPQSLSVPVMKMLHYPDMAAYPTSRSTRIECKVTTSASAGMLADSIYILYRLGSSSHQPIQRSYMTAIPGRPDCYRGYIPFAGYDTTIYYRVVAKDATSNHNATTFPMDEAMWQEYHNVRGTAREASVFPMGNTNYTTNNSANSTPFPELGVSKAQYIYPKWMLEQAGIGPGALTGILFTATTTAMNSARQNFQIRCANIPETYANNLSETNESGWFYEEFEKTVYDSSLTLSLNANTVGSINFQDTFYYAGGDLLISFIYQNPSTEPSLLRVRTIQKVGSTTTELPKATLYRSASHNYGFDPNSHSFFSTGLVDAANRPEFVFKVNANLPLIYDCGIAGLVTPNDSTSASAGVNNSIIVTLKNFGVNPINAARIYYRIDDSTAHYYDWTGTLAGGAQTSVTITSAQRYVHGYHEICVWTDDSITSGGVRYRDHEPLNNQVCSRFVACVGPMSGTVTVGSPSSEYANLDNFLYVLSQCGVSGPLYVNLTSGNYNGPFVFPDVPGASPTNFIQIQPANNTLGSVTFLSSSQYIVSLANAKYIRFKNIAFSTTGSIFQPYLVRLGMSSLGCQFLGCSFTEQSSGGNFFATALLYSGGADSMLVKNCTFSRGKVGISMVGPALDNMAHGNIIEGCTLTNQQNTGIILRNQVNGRIDSCTVTGIYTNSSYSILLQDCEGATRVTRNLIYNTKGAPGIGATGFNGTASQYAIIANNMIVCDDDGTANTLVTPLNFITATYTKVVHNSVKMTAPAHSGVAAATFGGGVIDNCQFYNNIVSCFDNSNYAFNYIPNQGNTNYIGYNIYYSTSPLLNKYNGISCATFLQWQGNVNDGSSQNVNPAFLGSTPTDLRSYSQNVKNHGMPIAEVTNDIYGTDRNTVAPCVGAFEFSSLPYDFEVYQMVEPYDEYCNVPANAPLRVVIKNSGVNAFIPGTGSNLHLTYSRSAVPGVLSPTNSGSINITDTIPALGSVVINTGVNVAFPTNGIYDTTYTFSFWLTSTIDPNPANDTSSFTVTSRYHYPAPNAVHDTILYGTADTLTITSGVQTWPVMVFNSGRQDRSTLYWYSDPTADYFHRGVPVITPILYTDTMFYVRQRRDLPLVKITEVQTKNNGIGVTYPQQLWMNPQTQLAVELTNVGDYPAALNGDTLQIVSNTSSLNKVYVFPNVTIQPGQTMTVQFRAGITCDSVNTLGGGSNVAPAYNANVGILYRDGRGIVDAVAINAITTQTNWTNLSVPSTVWSGNGISLDNTTAGIYRTHWPASGNSSTSNTQQYWQVADSVHQMAIGSTNTRLIRYTDNGCPSDANPVYIHITGRPDVDIALDELEMPSGCGLGNENVNATIHNYGGTASGPFVAHYSVNGVLACTDTLASLAPNATTIHTFSTPLNMYVATGSAQFNIVVWVDNLPTDISAFNDTTSVSVMSNYTPGAPVVQTYDTVQYGERLDLTTIAPSSDSLAWYNKHMQLLSDRSVYTTPNLYEADTFYVTAFGTAPATYNVGTLASTNSNSGNPSPYNPNKKYVKEQYLYTVDDLLAAGHGAGPISAVAFYLDSIISTASNPVSSFSFDDITVSIGSTTAANFSSNSAWATVTEVFSASNFTLTAADKGWVTHNFTTPFVWDGTSNIVVEVVHASASNVTSGARTRYTQAAANTVIYKADNTTSTIANFTGSGTRSPQRPDIQFTFLDRGCEGPASPVYVSIIGNPDVDASLQWPNDSSATGFNSCGPNDVVVTVRNRGNATLDSYSIDYWFDETHGVYNSTTSIAAHQTQDVVVASPTFLPGRHFIRAVVSATNDTVPTNDTISTIINVTFCGGTYTIGPAASNDYHSFTEAIDTLNNAGVAGPVVFQVQSGTYVEQLNLGAVPGADVVNTIAFTSASGDRSSVILRYATSNNSNYVLNFDGAAYMSFNDMTIYSAPASGNYANAVVLANAHNIGFNNSVIRVKGTINNASANAVVVGENVNNLNFLYCVIDSGYYGIKAIIPTAGENAGIVVDFSSVQNFWYQGIAVRKFDDVVIRYNQVKSGVNVTGRALTGINIAEVEGSLNIEANNVVLYDNKNGGKRGIQVVNYVGANAFRGKIYNNMCASYGTGVSGQPSSGIWIDSSRYINVFYNSTRVYAGVNAATTRAFSVTTSSSNIYVMNNIFSNFSKGYALYAQSAINITTSNYNVYYTSADTLHLAFWGAEANSLADLRAMNNQDANSIQDMPYFYGDDNLHLTYALFAERAQYNTEVPLDIDGEIRPQIPQPCIGADEVTRGIHNIGIMQFMEPTLDSNTVEADSLRVVVKLYNDGTSTETNVTWNAYIVNSLQNTGTLLQTPVRTVAELLPSEPVYDTAYIVLPIGLIDTQYIHAEIHYRPEVQYSDYNILDNQTDTVFFLEPAFDLRAETITVNDEISGVKGCRLHETPITLRLTNVGRKAIPSQYPITIGYQAVVQTANTTVTQLPLVHEEQVTLTADMAVNTSQDFTFATPANLYPTGNDKDVQIRVRAWNAYIYDQKHAANLNGRDTVPYSTITSKYTPNMPVGTDLHIPYATWDTIKAAHTDQPSATQQVHRPIRWYRDSTDAEPYYAPTAYAASTWWETPQYFHDSVYYLSCISTTGCTSYYNPVHVYLNAQVSNDAAVMAIESPYNKVYQNNDSVKIRIVNWGTSPISNIPVVYQFRRGTTLLQEVQEVCHATIQPQETYLYTFDSLVIYPTDMINPGNSNVNYTVRAWTDLANDQVRRNDTIRNLLGTRQWPESQYSVPVLAYNTGLDITRVSFTNLDNFVPEVGHSYLNFGNYLNPEVEPLHLIKGTTDTMLIEVANSDNHADYNTEGFITVYIDYNRDGYFNRGNMDIDSNWINESEVAYWGMVHSRHPLKFVYTLPDTAALGYTRMRVVLHQGSTDTTAVAEPFDFDFGQVQDYLLYIEDVPETIDGAVGRVTAPVDNIISADSTTVTFMYCNKGSEPIESAEVGYYTIHESPVYNSFTWTGVLEPGRCEPIALPTQHYDEGTTNFLIFVSTMGDTNLHNDTLHYQVHRFHHTVFHFEDSCENENYFYAPAGYNKYSVNLWERGYPTGKTNLTYCLSDSNAWVLNASGVVNTGMRGNLSYLYSPIFNIAQIRPDTISIWVAHQIGEGAAMYLEFWDYLGKWQKVGSANDTLWYTEPIGFTGNSAGYAFTNYRFPTRHISGDFQQSLQFRFVYYAPEDVPVSDGLVMDNIKFGRADRDIDAGVTDIVHPTHPKFGDIVYPKVAIHNYGTDTLRSVEVAYRPYGTYLAITGTFHGAIPPQESALYTFEQPFVVMSDFPDTFQICAYTGISLDLYHDNDTTCKLFPLSPLDNDMAITQFVYPLDHIVAGDSMQVTLRLRNYGQAPVSSCSVSYQFNNSAPVVETVDFQNLLGRDLESFEYFNYTFHRKCRASMGLMTMKAVVQYETDDYPFNDTIMKYINGLSNITDLYARAIVVDTTNITSVSFQLTIDNIGSRSANNFTVGYWYDNDTSTMVIEHFSAAAPLAALHTAYYVFDSVQPQRAGNPYTYVSGFVHIDGDNDVTNDTTSFIDNQFVDLQPLRIVVEENRNSECHVRMEVVNNGNMAYTSTFRVNATINGTSIHNSTDRVITPGEVFSIPFTQTIPKNNDRYYEGSGFVSAPYGDPLLEPFHDINASNNQTSVVEVENYFDSTGIGNVASNGMTLEQNQPNPYKYSTAIEFSIPTAGDVRFFVMDEVGRLVYQKEAFFNDGTHTIVLTNELPASGTYLYGIEYGGERLMRKMVYKK